MKLYQLSGSAVEQVKIIKGKHFGRSNEKGKAPSADVDRGQEEHDFGGTTPSDNMDSVVETVTAKNELASKPGKQRINHSKNTYGADEVVDILGGMDVLPADYRIIETRLEREFEHIEKVVEHRYYILRCVDAADKIVDVYVPRDKQDLRMPGVETIKGCPPIVGLHVATVTYALTFRKQATLYIDRLGYRQ